MTITLVDCIARTACSSCRLHALCVPRGVPDGQLHRVDELVVSRKRIRRGAHVYRAGNPFAALYAFRTGFFKSYTESEDGRAQVTGFPMPGDVAGLDGIASGRHRQSVVALEDGEACVIPLSRLEERATCVSALLRGFNRMVSDEIVAQHDMMMLLGTMRAEARLATFLLNLAQRFAARGYSPSEFNLRMTRADIGDYLGLKLETVSRLFSRFQEDKLIRVRSRRVEVLDRDALRRLCGRSAEPSIAKAA